MLWCQIMALKRPVRNWGGHSGWSRSSSLARQQRLASLPLQSLAHQWWWGMEPWHQQFLVTETVYGKVIRTFIFSMQNPNVFLVLPVLSAVSGIREKVPSLTESMFKKSFYKHWSVGTLCSTCKLFAIIFRAAQVVWISVPILFALFSVQRYGTDKVGYSFAPIITVWFFLIAGIGVYNLIVHEIGVLRAFNPMYIVDYFRRNGKEGWVSLGGVILCVTGNFSSKKCNCNGSL